MQNNGYNYRTLNPWEQIALEHLSALIGEIIGAGFDNPNNLIDRVSDMVLDLSNWDTPDNCDEEIKEIFDTSPNSDTQQPKYIPYGVSGEDGDKEINPAWEPTFNTEEDQKQDLSEELEKGYKDIAW
ncbi:hypothetical protein [Coleofasciculus sp. E1-EBD-02]|uniref:hypothetical protein n=1 Tax=Coleofasciculus sp. E1-EBD-02 TaxID=3068481 RepID=UPI0032FC5806